MTQPNTEFAKKWLADYASGMGVRTIPYSLDDLRHARELLGYIQELETIREKYHLLTPPRKLSKPPCPGGCGGTREILDDRGCYDRPCPVCSGVTRP